MTDRTSTADLETLPLRPIEFQVLLLLAEGPAHGYSIIRRTEERTGGRVKLQPGTLYRAIDRLESAALIHECDEPPPGAKEDRRRRYFALTSAGRDVAAQEARRLARQVRDAHASGLLRQRDLPTETGSSR